MKNKQATHSPFILASASKGRAELIEMMGLKPSQIIPADIDETEYPGELPRPLALRLAVGKAKAIRNNLKPDQKENFILAADTVVACGRRLLPKAETEDQARFCMKMISGRRHKIYGGISVIAPSGKQISRVVVTTVSFKRLTEKEIDWFIDTGDWEGKAGGYAIQGKASIFAKSIQGSHSNIVGLSCYDTIAMLTGLGFKL
ncbi:MAG: septum formation protein Maf [Alphaproteobacteria bacterium]|nr:septum formation protein Maf [Alphaproteobacteria bacterium]